METERSSNTKQIGNIGKDFVGMELFHRGAWIRQITGSKNIIEARSSDENRNVSIRVKSRASGDWQIRWTEGRKCQEPLDETSYWIFVDLTISKTKPDFYIIPDWWLRNDIYKNHHDWLISHGGVRPVTPESAHHRITLDRIEQWKDRWDILKLS